MYSDFINQIYNLFQRSEYFLTLWLTILVILWGINILNWLLGSPLNILGIYPRKIFGLCGIIFGPILHQNFSHLLFNSVPLFFLGLALLAKNGTVFFYLLTLNIAIVSGLGVWLFARKGLHIGASGVISGYFGYIVTMAYTAPSAITILYAALAIYYFGGIFIGLFPQEKTTSWESHVFGFIGGIASAYFFSLWSFH